MKKTFLILLSALLSLTSFAAGTTDGLTKETAIAFDWEKGNEHPGGNAALWYRVSLTPIYEEEDPTLALYLTNLSYTAADVKVAAVVAGNEETREYTIEPRKDRIWNQSAKMLVRMKYTEILVQLTASERVMLSAKVFDAEDADESCINATDYNWDDHSLNAGNRWYKLNLADARAKRQEIQITYSAAARCELNSTISPNCPSTGLTGDAAIIEAGGSYTHTISRALIQTLADDELYLKVENYTRVTVKTAVVDEPLVPPTHAFNNAKEGNLDPNLAPEDVTTAGQSFYVDIKDLKRKKLQPEIQFINDSNLTAATEVDVFIAFFDNNNASQSTTTFIQKHITAPAGETAVMDFAKNMIDGLDTLLVKYVYVNIVPSQNIQVRARMKHVHEGNACKNAQDLPWNSTTYQEGETTVWYAVDVTEAIEENDPQDITITVTNRADAKAYVTADVAFSCPYTDLQSVTRQMAAGASISKKLNYSTVKMMASVEENKPTIIYVGVTTDQPIKVDVMMTPVEKKVPDEACLNAVDFDWTYGNSQEANDTIWYAVNMKEVRNTNLIPEVVITNRGNAAVRIYGELSTECPDSIANESRTLTINANGTYTKTIARDMLNKISTDTIYIMLTANQPFAFRVNMIRENEGASCASAVLFNWVSGNDQAADTTVWYMMDLTEVKAAQGKQVRAIIKNLDRSKQSTISGLMATTCPCETPQAQSLTLTAGQEKERVIARSTFETFGDTLWFRLTTNTKIHFEAHLEDAEPFDTIYACDPAMGAQEVKFEQTYTQTTDTAWYYVLTQPILAETVKTPQLRIKNGSVEQNIMASIAYHCPIVEEMTSKTQSFKANQELKKTIERSLAERVADKDTVYIRVIGKGSFEFEVNMVDPNTGNDCQHAIIITPDSTIHQAAGESVWYRFNAGYYGTVKAEDKAIVTLGNEDGIAGAVRVTLYDACEGEVLQSGSRTLGANAVQSKEIMCEQFTGLSNDWVYIHIYTAQADSMLLRIVPRADIPTIWACQEAVPFMLNTDFYQRAGDTVWYAVNVKDIRENTMGDATLTVNNYGAGVNQVKAEMSWVCPVAKEMTSKTQDIAANGTYQRVIERSNFDMTKGHDIAYVRVISPDTMKFRIDLALAKGDECTNPIEFDWDKGNIKPKDQRCLWYNVRLVKDTVIEGKDSTTLLVPEGMDLMLYIDNLSDQTATASASLRFECTEKELGSYDYTFAPNDKKNKRIDRDLLQSVNPTSILINFCSSEAMYITAKYVNAQNDTIRDTVRIAACDQEDYEINGKIHHIDASDESTLTWEEHTQSQVGTMMVDSIRTIIVTPLVAADFVKQQDYPDSAKLVVAQGMKVDMTRLNNFLVQYYTDLTAADSLANYQNISWIIKDESINKWVPLTNQFDTPLDNTVTNIQIAYSIETECSTVTIEDTIRMSVQPWRTIEDKQTGWACMNGKYTWHDKEYTYTKDTVYTDTLFNVTSVYDTLGYKYLRQVDSIRVLTLKEKQTPVLPDASITHVDTMSMAYHTTFSMAPYTRAINDTLDNWYFGDESYSQLDAYTTWERKNLDDNSWAELTAGVNDTILEDAQVVLRYKVQTECGDILYSEEYTFTPTPDCTVFDVSTLNIAWPKAYCNTPYQDTIVLNAITRAKAETNPTDVATLYYRYNSADAWQAYVNGTKLTAGEQEVSFYVLVESTCGYKSQTEAKTLDINTPDMTDAQYEYFTSLPAVMKYDGWIIMVDLAALKAQYDFEPAESEITWYKMKGGEPNLTADAPAVQNGGYYYTIDKALVGNYYAVIDLPETVDECGGKYRTRVLSKEMTGAPADARKQLINGRLYITTDGNMYNAQGQKVE